MSVDAISALTAASAATPTGPAHARGVGTGFDALVAQVADLSEQMRSNETAVQALALGETENLHQVMMNMESTKLSFDLMLQVRNKMLDAYQELMRMQV